MNFRLLFCFVFFLGAFSTGLAQGKDSLSVYSYKELSNSFSKLRFDEPKTAKLYADAMLKKAIAEKNKKEEYNAYILQSKSVGYFGNMSKALTLANKCIAYAKEQKDNAFYVTAIKRKGVIYYNFGKYGQAIKHYLKVDSIARITGNIDYQIYSNQNIASLKTVLGDHKNAVKLYCSNG